MKELTEFLFRRVGKNDFEKQLENISIIFDKTIDVELKTLFYNFIKTMLNHYKMPIPLVIYVIDEFKIKASDGTYNDSVFQRPWYLYAPNAVCHLKIAVGDYQNSKLKGNKINAMYKLLWNLCESLSRYFIAIRFPHMTNYQIGQIICKPFVYYYSKSLAQSYIQKLFNSNIYQLNDIYQKSKSTK